VADFGFTGVRFLLFISFIFAPMLLLSPTRWKDYELLDCGNFEKLERFGQYITIRPEPQAVWPRTLSEKEWLHMAHVKFVPKLNNEYWIIFPQSESIHSFFHWY